MKPRILVIVGSIRQGRLADRVCAWLMRVLERRPEAEFELVDLRDHPLPFFDNPMPPASGEHAPEAQEWARLIGSADGFVMVTPEYNHAVPAVLKNALDHIYYEWNRKPVAIVSYGGHGGGYLAAEQLRSVVLELEMVVGSLALAWMAFDEAGELRQPRAEEVTGQMLDELIWWARTLRAARSEDLARSA
jgi:NAD(P)H-dependent FMN reductase